MFYLPYHEALATVQEEYTTMAASAKQITANRANAKKSTGPRTAAGKQVSRKNALVHGLLSKEMMVGGEDPAHYDALLDSLLTDFAPEGANEQLLVEKIAIALWKMKRLHGAEAATVKRNQMATRAHYAAKTEVEKVGLITEQAIQGLPANSLNFIRYQSQLEGQYYRAMTMLQVAQDRRAQRALIEL